MTLQNLETTSYIDGTFNLTEITNSIIAKERHFWEFKGNQVGIHNNIVVNFISFKAVDTSLPDLQFVSSADPKPSGKKEIWNGVMVSEGNMINVLAYR